jgi:hypothetical protein
MTQAQNHLDRAPRRATRGSVRNRGAVLAIVLAMSAGIAAACSSTPTTVPSLPTSVPSLPSSIPSGTGCLDATTMGIITQLQAQGADVPAILAANKDALISGLQGFEPTDQATLTWRDELVAALQAGDLTTAAARISALSTSGIVLAQC